MWSISAQPELDWNTPEDRPDLMKARFETPARRGWGQTAPSLYPLAANIGELGPLGGRLELEETEKLMRKNNKETSGGGNKTPQEKSDESDEFEEEAEDSLLSNSDVVRLLGLLLLSAGLIVTFLFIPVPNNWLINQDLVYMAGGVILLGATILLGAVIPCICSHFCRACCRRSEHPDVVTTRRVDERKIIKVSPAVEDDLIRAVYMEDQSVS